MKLHEFLPLKSTTVVVEQILDEINMSPSSLRQLAGAIDGAKAGMEFEMIVPGVENPDDADMEPDYDQDERVDSIQDAVDFFDDGDHNTSRDLRRLKERMQDDYTNWLFSEFAEKWDSDREEFVYSYIRDNLDENDIAEILGLDEEEAAAIGNDARKYYQAATNRIVNDELEPYLDDAREDAESDFINEDREADWLESEGLEAMADVERQYEINWPHWTSSSDGGGGSVEGTAQEFESMIGKPVKWSASYHGAKRDATSYVVEPDGSLEGDAGDSGLEFVSPPMPINDMLTDLEKTVKWAGQTGCYTNNSTGLHINVSVPGTEDSQNIDYVKLALLLGDNYILEQFGRAGNTYCKSGMEIIKERVAQRPEDAQALLEKMRAGLDAMASKLIHSGNTQKFTSINMKDGYVEFRSPGGDWLEEYSSGKGKIENALLRFVVALDAAVKPELYKQEYLKKLYAMLQPKSKDDTLAYFAKYAAGELPKAALKSFVRQAQLERQSGKVPSSTGAANYKIYRITDGRTMETFYAADRAGAEDQFRDWLMSPAAGASDNFRYAPIDTVIQGADGQPIPSTGAQAQQAATQPAGGGTWTGQWIVKNEDTDQELYRFGGVGNSQSDANRVALEWIRSNAPNTDLVQIVVVPEMR